MQQRTKNGESLKLQSYKVDNQVLVSKINELNDLKSELENTLSKHRNQENSFTDEREHLKTQNEKLRAFVSDLEFTKKSQTYLIQQLEKRLEAAENKAQTYLQKYQNEQRQKLSLQSFYQKKIVMLNDKKQPFRNSNQGKFLEISKVTEYKNPSQPPFKIENNSISSIEGSSKHDSNKKIKKLKKPSIQTLSPQRPSVQITEKYSTANVIVERQDDSHLSGEDIYLQMIRQLYKQLLKIEIRGRQLFKIPQIQAFSQLRNPSKNDLAKLCNSYPFHIRQAHKVDLIYEYISKESQRRGKLMNGRFFIDQIIEQIEQIDGSQELRSNDGELSSYFNDSEVNHGKFQSEKFHRTSAQGYKVDREDEKKYSFDSGIDLDSENSNYY